MHCGIQQNNMCVCRYVIYVTNSRELSPSSEVTSCDSYSRNPKHFMEHERSLDMYVCMYIHMYIYMCVPVCLHVRRPKSVHIVPMSAYEYMHAYLCMFSGLENRKINGWGDPLRWPHDTLYPQKLALTSLTSGGRSVGIVRLRTKSHGV
jgi:hypothetical protein